MVGSVYIPDTHPIDTCNKVACDTFRSGDYFLVNRVMENSPLLKAVTVNVVTDNTLKSASIGAVEFRDVSVKESSYRPQPVAAVGRQALLRELDLSVEMQESHLINSDLLNLNNLITTMNRLTSRIKASFYRNVDRIIYEAMEASFSEVSAASGSFETRTATDDDIPVVDASAGFTFATLSEITVQLNKMDYKGSGQMILLPLEAFCQLRDSAKTFPGMAVQLHEVSSPVPYGGLGFKFNDVMFYTPFGQPSYFRARDYNGSNYTIGYAFAPEESIDFGYRSHKPFFAPPGSSPILNPSMVEIRAGPLSYDRKNGIFLAASTYLSALRIPNPVVVKILFNSSFASPASSSPAPPPPAPPSPKPARSR
ncbi:hypothetical protein ASSaV_gp29 [Abalone shriveling syndrome-associated virus]|uniref:hypothetical protein n=1 Tax=Abalone shriveling syndrome-associated virus TaxID=491893 RepID=UPI0001881BA7|nr:hypothetical protein ASSaV_gp29 [Abalone shriveling syndrome-associated virus]ACJ71976.1 unknown [Abalone shriveling syndrome-associated virus]